MISYFIFYTGVKDNCNSEADTKICTILPDPEPDTTPPPPLIEGLEKQKGITTVVYAHILCTNTEEYVTHICRILSNLPSSFFPSTCTLESRKKNDSPLSAAWWTISRLYRVLCKVYKIEWVNFRLFSNFMHFDVVCPWYNWENAKYLRFWFKIQDWELAHGFLSKLLVFCKRKSEKAFTHEKSKSHT